MPRESIRKKCRSSDSPSTVSPTASQISPSTPPPQILEEQESVKNKKLTSSPSKKHHHHNHLRAIGAESPSYDSSGALLPPTTFVQHPSEEVPTATSSSLLSLFVPTTDSGISLPTVCFKFLFFISGIATLMVRKESKCAVDRKKI